jgi:hypothetical protein
LAKDALTDYEIMVRAGAFLVDSLPWRTVLSGFARYVILIDTTFAVQYLPSWAPGAGFKKVAAKMRERVVEFINAPFDLVRSQMVHLTHVIIPVY